MKGRSRCAGVRSGNAESEVDFEGVFESAQSGDFPCHPPAGEADAKPNREGRETEDRFVAVANGEDERPHFAILNGGEGRVVERDHRRVVVRLGKCDVPLAACPEFVRRGRIGGPEPAVRKCEEVGLVTVATHGPVL